MGILNAITFLAAFLLFQIELIIAKLFLPHYGGSYLVWGGCVVFFQAALLLGYVFAHFFIQRLSLSKYRYLHLALFIITLFTFPGKALLAFTTQSQLPMMLDVFWQLALSIGLVFFLLSTVSITTQSWLADSHLPQRKHPYSLYAFSNLGSFAALISYPFYFEANFGLDQQLIYWRVGYAALFVGQWILFFSVRVHCETAPEQESAKSNLVMSDIIRWILLGAGGVMLFLSVTHILTNEIAPIPLLWVIPLSIYLLAFVLNFREKPLCPGWISRHIAVIIGLSVLLYFLSKPKQMPVIVYLISYCVSLFLLCMYCQNRLYTSRPQEKRDLTTFYVMMSCGGFLGGVIVSWVIPIVSISLIEFLAGLYVLSFVFLMDDKREYIPGYYIRLLLYLVTVLLLWPVYFHNYNFVATVFIVVFVIHIFHEFRKIPKFVFLALLAILILEFSFDQAWSHHTYVYRHRNYYGTLKVRDEGFLRHFFHGTTMHGSQITLDGKRREPVAYYHPLTPVGGFLQSEDFDYQRIGILGLGVGELAAYFKEGQEVDFFELDRDVYDVAKKYFTYLEDSPAQINVIFGDARTSLEKVPNHTYDLLIVDVFSGDSIPVHLLTTEAIKMYRDRIKEDGIIIFHYSNRYFSLKPLISAGALSQGALAAFKQNPMYAFRPVLSSYWAVMTWDKDKFAILVEELKWEKIDEAKGKDVRLWTDNYSNLLPYIKLKHHWQQVRGFNVFSWKNK